MSAPGGYVEQRRLVRSAEDLAMLVLRNDYQVFEREMLKLWRAHVRQVTAEAARAWLDVEADRGLRAPQ